MKQINEALGGKIIRASDLVIPPQPDFGDLSLACFEAGRKVNKSAVEAAGWLVGEIAINGGIAGIKAIGPYLNFTLDKTKLAKGIIKEITAQTGDYGTNDNGKGKRVMIEYSNVNTHKAYHIGHLRNICFGDAVSRILSANGYCTIPISYINDFGIHTAKTLWAFMEFYKSQEPKTDSGRFLGKVYAKAVAEMEQDPLANDKVTFLMRKIESRQGEEYKLWQKTRKWSIKQFDNIYKELGIEFKHTYYENEFLEKGLEMVAKLYKQELLKKSEGAVIADLNEYGLDILMFLRSDGTAMYPVADLPLAFEKFKRFKLDRSIYVTDIRQNLHFKQLFKVLELAGVKGELVHLGHEFVKLPEGMMSSRKGTLVTYEDLRDMALKRAKEETAERHQDWSDKKIKEVANALVNGAIKFEMIKVSATQVITFDINQALRFDGFTAAYLQYTCARINSIIRKDGSKQTADGSKKTDKVDFNKLGEAREHGLVMKLARYPEVVAGAGEKYDPSEIAKYLFELAQGFNDYYHQVPVLKAEIGVREARLALITVVSQVIANGLGLLGIETVPEM